MIDFTQVHTWNKCPRCGKPVPPNEWISYMRCENCWADNPHNPSGDAKPRPKMRARPGKLNKKKSPTGD